MNRILNKKFLVGLGLLLTILIAAVIIPFPVSPDEEAITFTTWNLEWFFDHDQSDNASPLSKNKSAKNADEYQCRLELIAEAIAEMNPTVLALQEIENQKAAQDLSKVLKEKYRLEYSVGFIQGYDTYTEQDVAFLVQKRLDDIETEADYPNYFYRNIQRLLCRWFQASNCKADIKFSRVESTGFDFSNPELYTTPSKHLAMHIVLKSRAGDLPLTLITAHLKSGVKPSDELQRKKQSRVLHKWAGELMNKGNSIVMLGDFNGHTKLEETSADNANGILCGLETPAQEDDLFDLHWKLSPESRKTHVSGSEVDRILISYRLLNGSVLIYDGITNHRNLVFKSGKLSEKCQKDKYQLSDHYPLEVKFKFIR